MRYSYNESNTIIKNKEVQKAKIYFQAYVHQITAINPDAEDLHSKVRLQCYLFHVSSSQVEGNSKLQEWSYLLQMPSALTTLAELSKMAKET